MWKHQNRFETLLSMYKSLNLSICIIRTSVLILSCLWSRLRCYWFSQRRLKSMEECDLHTRTRILWKGDYLSTHQEAVQAQGGQVRPYTTPRCGWSSYVQTFGQPVSEQSPSLHGTSDDGRFIKSGLRPSVWASLPRTFSTCQSALHSITHRSWLMFT